MSALGSILAGMAVAVAGVAIGRRLEHLKDARSTRKAAHGGKIDPLAKETDRQARATILDADPDPHTGTYTTKSR